VLKKHALGLVNNGPGMPGPYENRWVMGVGMADHKTVGSSENGG